MKIYTVSVDSEDYHEGQWNDLLIVSAPDEDEAGVLARVWVADQRNTREWGETEVYEYKGETARVLGQLEVD
jgi:hypothetical protein